MYSPGGWAGSSGRACRYHRHHRRWYVSMCLGTTSLGFCLRRSAPMANKQCRPTHRSRSLGNHRVAAGRIATLLGRTTSAGVCAEADDTSNGSAFICCLWHPTTERRRKVAHRTKCVVSECEFVDWILRIGWKWETAVAVLFFFFLLDQPPLPQFLAAKWYPRTPQRRPHFHMVDHSRLHAE